MSGIFAMIVSNLVPVVVTAIGGLLTWAATKLTKASESKNKSEAAWAKLGNVAVTVAGKMWSKLAPEIQARLADGKLDAEDRAAITALVEQCIKDLDLSDTVAEAAKALNLPLASIIGYVTERTIDRVTKAHDPASSEVSVKAFPVSANDHLPASARAQ